MESLCVHSGLMTDTLKHVEPAGDYFGYIQLQSSIVSPSIDNRLGTHIIDQEVVVGLHGLLSTRQ
jgi:hypothetical protein